MIWYPNVSFLPADVVSDGRGAANGSEITEEPAALTLMFHKTVIHFALVTLWDFPPRIISASCQLSLILSVLYVVSKGLFKVEENPKLCCNEKYELNYTSFVTCIYLFSL